MKVTSFKLNPINLELFRTFTLIFLAILLGLSCTIAASGKGYYINSLTGLDTNPGTSAIAAWKSLERAKTAPLQAGDTLFLARGSSFTGGLEITASGTADRPIVLTAFGKGNALCYFPSVNCIKTDTLC